MQPEVYHVYPDIRQAKVWIAGRTPKDGKSGKPEFMERVSKIISSYVIIDFYYIKLINDVPFPYFMQEDLITKKET